MPLLANKERVHFKGRIEGCQRCGRRRGMVRRYQLRLCRQCFRDGARDLGFKKYN